MQGPDPGPGQLGSRRASLRGGATPRPGDASQAGRALQLSRPPEGVDCPPGTGHRVAGTQNHASRGSKPTMIPQTHTPSTELCGQQGSVPPGTGGPLDLWGTLATWPRERSAASCAFRKAAKHKLPPSEALSTPHLPRAERAADAGAARPRRRAGRPGALGAAAATADAQTRHVFDSRSRPRSGPSASMLRTMLTHQFRGLPRQ